MQGGGRGAACSRGGRSGRGVDTARKKGVASGNMGDKGHASGRGGGVMGIGVSIMSPPCLCGCAYVQNSGSPGSRPSRVGRAASGGVRCGSGIIIVC